MFLNVLGSFDQGRLKNGLANWVNCDRQALGEGAFGRVMQASAADIVHSGENTTVAVKMLKEGHTDQVRMHSDREKCLPKGLASMKSTLKGELKISSIP